PIAAPPRPGTCSRGLPMPYRLRWPFVLAASALCLWAVGHTAAVAPEVRDEGNFFSPAALKKADERVRDIYRKHGRDVLVETFATVPADDVEKVKAMEADQRNAYFLKWAKARADLRVVNGVYVLLCKEPLHWQVGVVEKEPRKFAPDS